MTNERQNFESTGLGRFRDVRVKGAERVSWTPSVSSDTRDGTVWLTTTDTTTSGDDAHRMTWIGATGWLSRSTNGWVVNVPEEKKMNREQGRLTAKTPGPGHHLVSSPEHRYLWTGDAADGTMLSIMEGSEVFTTHIYRFRDGYWTRTGGKKSRGKYGP